MTSARWSEAEARAALEALARSGEPVTRFAAHCGVAASRLYVWRRRLSASASAPLVTAPAFVEVKPESRARGGDERLEIVLRTGEILRVPNAFDEVALLRVLTILRAEGSC